MILCGDALIELRKLAENFIDSIVTDPPYELGFMGKGWDKSGIAYNVEMWQECLRVLKPGGYLLSFGGSRTYHRMACAIEDAGFEIRDQIMWVYGSGFPKSHDVSKAIDKAAGVEREIIGPYRFANRTPNSSGKYHKSHNVMSGATRHPTTETFPATDAAHQWQGWGTALKPAHEPICVARKPLSEGTVAENVQKWGTGAMNVDGCRIKTSDKLGGGGATTCVSDGWDRPFRHEPEAIARHKDMTANNIALAESLGRWPANLIHDGSEEVVGLFDMQCRGQRASRPRGGKTIHTTFKNAMFNMKGEQIIPSEHLNDSGSAARFFYCAKASRAEREAGLEGMEERPLLWSSGIKNPGSFQSENTHRAAKNHHPTVKPLALMRYLVRLVTPPNGLVLDPFMGSGTTGMACMAEGFEFIGIEIDKEYFEIAKKRIYGELQELSL